MPRIKVNNTIQKRGYHMVNKHDSDMIRFTGKIPHHVIKVGEDDESEVGVVISKSFKTPEFTKQLNKIDITNKNWHFGSNQDKKPISLEKVSEISKAENSEFEPLLKDSKASGTLIRLYPGSVIETRKDKMFSQTTLENIEIAVRESLDKNQALNPKTSNYELIDIEFKPIGYYKPIGHDNPWKKENLNNDIEIKNNNFNDIDS